MSHRSGETEDTTIADLAVAYINNGVISWTGNKEELSFSNQFPPIVFAYFPCLLSY